jgi:probable O-glycosylation ligase (exosortase A-associated)
MFAIVWMALLPVSFMSAHVGVLIWVWVALLSPSDLLVGFMSGVPFNKIVALTTLLLFFASRERKDPYLDTTLVMLLLFAFTATISWSTGLVSADDSTDIYQKLLKEMVLVFMITSIMTTRHRLNLLVLTIVLSLGFTSVKEGLISVLTVGGHKILGSGSVGDNNSVATAVLMIVPLTYYLARHAAVRVVRIGLYCTLGLSLITVVMTFSRGGFVGLLLLGLFMVAKSASKGRALLLVATVAILTYALAPESWFERLSTIKDADNDGSFMGRVVAWKISWLIAVAHPLFGGGLHAVQHLNVWSTFRPQLPSLDFIKTPPADLTPHAAHSIYFEVLGDLGFTGLFLFVGVILMAIWNCRWINRRARNHPSLAWVADLASMTQLSLILYMATGAALSMGYFELLYILLALVSRCRRLVRKTLEQEAVAELIRTETAIGMPAGVRLPEAAMAEPWAWLDPA